ncbi:cation:proton antiporter [Leptothoe sp. PORK10 BA2]|uniref:cation:proton antiporter n=1 Tax=Leptothoe sp. PORK10 BA2 TaxID=3110254 RepID=UPI002B20C884|nr:cation:proton antiporter [Leptothoe sp. PORK10 BA2]MEA5464216.1 cation:proton antiporter [Leptothoe sp. PORK10 BA2]
MAAATSGFILDLTTVLGASALGGYLSNRLKQPVLLGYLLAGLMIGPLGLRLVNDTEAIQGLAELGVAFLLFSLGVQFSLAELNRVRNVAIQGSVLQIGITTAAVATITCLLGWATSLTQGIFLGAVLSLSSTAVVLKTLTERGETNTRHGQIMLAILIAQDLALGVMLAIVPSLNSQGSLLPILGLALLKVVGFIGGAIAAGYWLVPRIIRAVARTESDELFLLTLLALCLSVALITARLGLSIEIGAFAAGLMIAEIDYADHALSRFLPLRDTFACLFFTSIGMLIDPQILIQNAGIILGLVALTMVGKALIVLPVVLSFGYSFKTSLRTSLGINQIGEFSFVLALVGLDNNLISEQTYLLLLGATAITLVFTPFLFESANPIAETLLKSPHLGRFLTLWESPQQVWIEDALTHHIVVAGYGRVGQVVVNILRQQNHPVLVIENNEAAIQTLRHRQIPYILGDADSEQILDKAHLDKALALAITLPAPTSTRLLLKRALAIAPDLDVIARAHITAEIDSLTQAGAREVVQPEFEAALELGSHLLKILGKAPMDIQTTMEAIRLNRYLSIREGK